MFNLHNKSSKSTVLLFVTFVKHPMSAAKFVPNPSEKERAHTCKNCYKMGTLVSLEIGVPSRKDVLEFLKFYGINVFFKRDKNAESMSCVRKRPELRPFGQPFT